MFCFILISFSCYLLVSSSFLLIYYPSRFFHIAHAITFTFSAYFAYFFSKQLLFPIWLSIPLAIICAAVIGVLPEIMLYKPLRRHNASPMTLMIASLGLYYMLQNVISLVWGDGTKSVRTGKVNVGYEFLGAYITDIQIIAIVVCLTLFIACVIFMKCSRIGRNIRAVASNPELRSL